MKKIEIPLYDDKKKKGRPVRWDYSPFLKMGTQYVVLKNADESNYSSIRSTLTRWKKINNVYGKFEYDFNPEKEGFPKCVIVWRV
jgi:hypothetical protein